MASVGSDVPTSTKCVIQNNTGLEAKLDDSRDWAGLGPAPAIIEDKKSGDFKHTADIDGSVGAVVFKGVHEYRWILAWSNKPTINNQAYTKILKPRETFDWDDIKNKLNNASNTATDSISNFSSYVVIDITGGAPTFTAGLKYEAP